MIFSITVIMDFKSLYNPIPSVATYKKKLSIDTQVNHCKTLTSGGHLYDGVNVLIHKRLIQKKFLNKEGGYQYPAYKEFFQYYFRYSKYTAI